MTLSGKGRHREAAPEPGGFAGSGFAFVLGAAAALILQRFGREIARGAVTGAVRAQRKIKEISSEVMEDIEDVWAEESENDAAPGSKPKVSR